MRGSAELGSSSRSLALTRSFWRTSFSLYSPRGRCNWASHAAAAFSTGHIISLAKQIDSQYFIHLECCKIQGPAKEWFPGCEKFSGKAEGKALQGRSGKQQQEQNSRNLGTVFLPGPVYYRDKINSLQIQLSRTPAGPGRAVKEQQEQN